TSQQTKTNPEFLIWQRYDRLVLTWINATVTKDLIPLLYNCNLASTAWTTLHNHFLDQSLAKELDLKLKLHNLQKGSLSIETYCKHFKEIFDSLDAISQPISDREQVMYVLKGLPPTYDSVVTFASNLRPAPTFHDVWNMLLTQEARLDHLGNTPSESSITVQPTALLSSHKTSTTSPQSSQVNPPRNSSFNSTRGGRSHFRGRGRGRGYGGRGGRFSYQPQYPRPSYGMFNPQSFYPTIPNSIVSSAGILGSSPSAAIKCQLCDQMGHTAKSCSSHSQAFTSNDNNSQFAGFSMNESFDPTWYLDSGATSHMTNDIGQGNFFINATVTTRSILSAVILMIPLIMLCLLFTLHQVSGMLVSVIQISKHCVNFSPLPTSHSINPQLETSTAPHVSSLKQLLNLLI
ncbi:hypothetical protein L195_g028261, partial [Trifolium pratense]